jgi:phosphoserine phosphatase
MKKELKVVVAIAYDFDGTLAAGNMQEYDFIPGLGMKPDIFWKESKALALKNNADPILAYMKLMLDKASKEEIPVKKQNFADFGKKIKLFDGVDTWFKRMNEYGKKNGIKVEHYIISSGLREMIEGTEIAKHFQKIYASGFMYDHNGTACWPALAVNYTTKTQYLFRINKGSLEESDNSKINDFQPQDERPVPFSNMIFIGDGETDIPCMKLVKSQGGYSIAVYQPRKSKDISQKLVIEGRATLSAVADYSEGKDLDITVKAIIDKVAAQMTIQKVVKRNARAVSKKNARAVSSASQTKKEAKQ